MTPRCKPGDLAEIVYSLAGNEGRRGVIERAADHGDWCLGNGPLLGLEPNCWVFRPLQPLRSVQDLYEQPRVVSFSMDPTIYPDLWLKPVRDELADDLAIETSKGEVAHA